jgi:hypothetical protein
LGEHVAMSCLRFAACVLCFSFIAQGAPPRIGVVVVPLDVKAAAGQGLFETQGLEALKRAEKFEVLELFNAANPRAAEARSHGLESAQVRLAEGKKALDELDTVKAAEQFTGAMAAAKAGNWNVTFGLIMESQLMRAAAHSTGGEIAPAKKDIENLVGLKNEVELSPSFFSPDLIKFAEVQRKLATTTKDELLIQTVPSGARVWVDGTFRGLSPVSLQSVTPEAHLVSLALGSHGLTQLEAFPGENKVTLEPSEQQVSLDAAIGLISKDFDGPGRDSGAKQLAKLFQVDQLLVVIPRKSLAGEQFDMIVARIDARDGHNLAFAQKTLKPESSAMAALLDSVLAKDDLREGKLPRTHYKAAPSSSHKTAAGVALLGVGAAALATGVVFGIMTNQQHDLWLKTPQTQLTNSNDIQSKGKTFALVADISYLVGVVAAGTGTVVLLTGDGEAEKPPAPAVAIEQPKKKPDEKKAVEAKPTEPEAKEVKKEAPAETLKKEEKAPEEKLSAKEKKRRLEEAKKAEDERKKEEVAAKKQAEADKRAEAAAQKNLKSFDKKKAAEEEAKKKEEEALKKTEEEARKKAEEEARRKAAEAKKKPENKKKEDDADDLRNF